MLFDGGTSLLGPDVAAGARIIWMPEVGLISSVGTTPCEFELTALQMRMQAL
ncbi:hypothetical protein D3C85_1032910 [compost metagenome]